MTTGSLGVLSVISHNDPEIFLLLGLRWSYKPANDSSVMLGAKAGLFNNQKMLFRYECADLKLTYLNHE